MKTVWILNHYAQEPGGVGGTRHYDLARHLPCHGWKAIIVAASVEYQTGRQRLPASERWRLDECSGVQFLWLRTPEYSGNGVGRIRNMLAVTLAALRPSSFAELAAPNLVIGSSVHPLAAWAGCMLASRFRVPFVFEVRDLWPQTLIDMGRLSERSSLTRALRGLERKLFRDAARIVTLLPGAHEYVERAGVSRNKVVWIPNGVDLSAYPPPPSRSQERVFTLMYFGAHGSANGLDNVLRAMKRLAAIAPDLPAVLRLIGDGPEKPALMELAGQLGLANVSFEPPVPRRRIPGLAAQADAFVFNLIGAEVFKYGISSNKLFDFMAGSRPVIFSCAAGNNPVDEAGGGLTVPPEDADALARAVLALAQLNPGERARMGSAARRYVEEHHSFDELAGRLVHELDACLGKT